MTKENNKLEHLAIIMDGNGRWAARRGLPRSMGHRKGAEVVKEITRAAGELGIKYLTLYAFSTENWNRSEDEVKTLMGLLRDYLQSDLKEVQQNNVRIRFIGEREMLDADIVRKMAEIEADTLRNTGMTLCIALSYGSRQEIVNAVKKTAALVKEGDISLNDVDVKLFLICSTPKTCRTRIWLSEPAASSASAIIFCGRSLMRNFSLPMCCGRISTKSCLRILLRTSI